MKTILIFKGVGAEFEFGAIIADFVHYFTCDGFRVDLIPARAGNFAGINNQIGADERFAGHAAFGILREAGIKDGVGNLIADFVWVAFRNRFGCENMVDTDFAHSGISSY